MMGFLVDEKDLREAREQAEQYRRDAERYRKLKAVHAKDDENDWLRLLLQVDFDAAVDALPEAK